MCSGNALLQSGPEGSLRVTSEPSIGHVWQRRSGCVSCSLTRDLEPREPLMLASENQVAEAQDAAIAAQILGQSSVESISESMCLLVVRVSEQPFFGASSPCGLEVVPLPLVRRTYVQYPPTSCFCMSNDIL